MHTVVGILLFDSKYYWFGEHRPAKGFSTEVGVTATLLPIYVTGDTRGPCLYRKKRANEIEKGCIMERPKVIYKQKGRRNLSCGFIWS